MLKYENECVGCTDLGMRCMGRSCPNRKVAHFYCDECDCEEDLYYFDGDELCGDCIAGRLEKVDDCDDCEDYLYYYDGEKMDINSILSKLGKVEE